MKIPNKNRPQAPLPHRPMSAGPILHHHPQHQQQQQQHQHHPHHPHHQLLHRSVVVSGAGRQMGGSHNDIPRYVISPSRGGRLNARGGFKVNAFLSSFQFANTHNQRQNKFAHNTLTQLFTTPYSQPEPTVSFISHSDLPHS